MSRECMMLNYVLSDPGILESFETGNKSGFSIRFFDPSYVRSETILYEKKTRQIHAILHENIHYIGIVPESMSNDLSHGGEVSLIADHYSGKPVCLRARVAVC